MKEKLELYIHIPFCVKKCAYCDFLSAPAGDHVRQECVEVLCSEIRACKEEYRSWHVETIFLGGGTPSVLDPEQITRIFEAIYSSFSVSESAEITIEANPGTVTKEKVQAWKSAGVNRISIGLQSVNEKELRLLGRIHSYHDFLDTFSMVREAGIKNINVDLISALPGQTPQDWERTLRTVAELEPEHISAYSLIIEEGTPFYDLYGEEKITNAEDCIPLPDEDTERMIYEETELILKEYGFERYEISNYAKKGFECRHNIGYWKRVSYLGLGLGASSLIGNLRFKNPTDYEVYIEKVKNHENHREEQETLNSRQEEEEFMFLGLRLKEGIKKQEFLDTFKRTVEEVYGNQIRTLKEYGLLEEKNDCLRLTERGTDLSNYVFGQFLQ